VSNRTITVPLNVPVYWPIGYRTTSRIGAGNRHPAGGVGTDSADVLPASVLCRQCWYRRRCRQRPTGNSWCRHVPTGTVGAGGCAARYPPCRAALSIPNLQFRDIPKLVHRRDVRGIATIQLLVVVEVVLHLQPKHVKRWTKLFNNDEEYQHNSRHEKEEQGLRRVLTIEDFQIKVSQVKDNNADGHWSKVIHTNTLKQSKQSFLSSCCQQETLVQPGHVDSSVWLVEARFSPLGLSTPIAGSSSNTCPGATVGGRFVRRLGRRRELPPRSGATARLHSIQQRILWVSLRSFLAMSHFCLELSSYKRMLQVQAKACSNNPIHKILVESLGGDPLRD
jgi:hypothetical protein